MTMGSPEPPDYVTVPVLTMNMAGRFTGREIKSFGQNVLKHLLTEKKIGIFMGQQISFKPNLPPGYEYVGSNRAFMCYDREVVRVTDERQYRHFLRDLHMRGHLPHHYLPENNYVVLKMKFRQKPWFEFIAMTWMTDEKQPKLKNQGQLRKVITYAMHLAETEDMPVIVGGAFRLPLDDCKKEMEGDLRCYGYKTTTEKRRIRMCNVFLCAKPMKMESVKPLVCSNMGFGMENAVRWMNPEDAFYWDPIIGDLLLPVETPENMAEAEKFETKVNNLIKENIQKQGVSSSMTRPITGISSKHLLVSAGRSTSLHLPTAPVLPTPQEAPPPSPDGSDSYDEKEDFAGIPTGSRSELSAIDEVSSEYERQEGFMSSDSETVRGFSLASTSTEGTYSISDGDYQRRDSEDQMFELLENMMNDKSSTFFVGKKNGTSQDTQDLSPNQERHDPATLEDLKASMKAQSQEGDPEEILQQLMLQSAQLGYVNRYDENGEPNNDQTHVTITYNTSLTTDESEVKLKRAQSYVELYDEELIENNTTCYMQ